MSTRRNVILAVGGLLVSGLLLSGCYEDEQGRVLRHEAGVYKGKIDSALNEETRRELGHRAKNQGL